MKLLAEFARPAEVSGRWGLVSADAQRVAIEQARADAGRHVIQAVGEINLNPNERATEALVRPAISLAFSEWLARRPIASIDFSDGLSDGLTVSVTISINHASMAGALRSAVERDSGFATDSPIDWSQVNKQIDGLLISAAGVGSASERAQATTLPAAVLPTQPPDWTNQQLQAEAVRAVEANGCPRLKAARQAEAAAVEKLRTQFLGLPLDDNTKLRDAVHDDAALNQAVDRALLLSHTYQVDYQADGSVRVKMSLDLQQAWDELRNNP